jgi:hypothetical protein
VRTSPCARICFIITAPEETVSTIVDQLTSSCIQLCELLGKDTPGFGEQPKKVGEPSAVRAALSRHARGFGDWLGEKAAGVQEKVR